jgi:AP-3 complex subunit delta-1
LPYLLHSDISQLAPETIAVYLLSAAKIFSYWAADLAERWDDDLLQDVKDTVDSVMEGLQPFVSSNHSEVQERVRVAPGSVQHSAKHPAQAANVHQLFSFVKADLRGYKPPVRTVPSAVSSGFEEEPESGGEPTFPKSLFLLYPLFTSYDLNPVAEHAQASVPTPDGLDLDVWIVSPPPAEEQRAENEELAVQRRTRKSKKGKEKEEATMGTTNKEAKKKKRHDAPAEVLTAPEDTPEEQAESQRVSRSKG